MKEKIFQINSKVILNRKISEKYFKMLLDARQISDSACPGQFVEIRVVRAYEPLLRRPFSIHRVKGQGLSGKGGIEILYEIKGKGTQILSQKKPGEFLDVIGPLGNGFNYEFGVINYKLPIFLVAGGMGVAPLLFLAEELITHNFKLITVLIGARTKEQVLCKKEFRNLGCDVKIATDDGSAGFKGRVTELLEKILATGYRLQAGKNKKQPGACGLRPLSAVYACGPEAMLREVVDISRGYRVSSQLCFEEMMGCGIGACLGCVIRTTDGYRRICKDGPVFFAKDML